MPKRWLSIAGIIFFLLAVFCAGFVFFYTRMQRSQAEAPQPRPSKSLIDRPFPPAQLVDLNGSAVDEQILRTGRVVIVFITTDCDACATESKFLEPLVGRRSDVTFYGLVPFGPRPKSPAAAEKMFPFKIFFDQENSFIATMGINRVPVKVFLEDGIIKKGWIGAAITEKDQKSFIEWLDTLP
jgi:hypothetical protein